MSSRSSNNYRAITLSGLSGTGKSALFRNLKPHLEPLGYHFHAAGEFFRQTSGEFLHPTPEKLSDDFHRQTEDRLESFLRNEDHVVIDAWLGGFIAKDMPDVLRVLTYVSDPTERVRRYARREKVSHEEAAAYIQDRDARNLAKWQELYGDYDFWDPEYYQLRIDTAKLNHKECVKEVLDKLVI